MKNILENTKDFKIIPDNFKSSGEFEIISISDNEFKIKLSLADNKELQDYQTGNNVEIFGVNDIGLIYFETKITGKEDFIITLATTQDYSMIQRREYSRVKLAKGQIIFKDIADNIVKEIKDISAGGVKFVCNQALTIDKVYEIEIILSNNMKIECGLSPIRVTENNGEYAISAKFVNLENVDRVVLVQYAFKTKMENQNKGN